MSNCSIILYFIIITIIFMFIRAASLYLI